MPRQTPLQHLQLAVWGKLSHVGPFSFSPFCGFAGLSVVVKEIAFSQGKNPINTQAYSAAMMIHMTFIFIGRNLER